MTEQNTLIGYYECRKSDSDWADIDLKVIRSTDKGEHFETVWVISSNGNTLNNPMMTVMEKEIHFLFCKNYKELFYCKSCGKQAACILKK
jgi:sialidase (precursor)